MKKYFLLAVVLYSSLLIGQTKELFFAGMNFTLNKSFEGTLQKVDTNSYNIFRYEEFVVIMSKNPNQLVGTLYKNDANNIIKIIKHWGHFNNIVDGLSTIHYLLSKFTSNSQHVTTSELVEPEMKFKDILLTDGNRKIDITIYEQSIQIMESIQ